jgi:hypothetical protein
MKMWLDQLEKYSDVDVKELNNKNIQSFTFYEHRSAFLINPHDKIQFIDAIFSDSLNIIINKSTEIEFPHGTTIYDIEGKEIEPSGIYYIS